MPKFLDFVELGVSRVDGNKMWVYIEIVGIKKTGLGSIEIRKEKCFSYTVA